MAGGNDPRQAMINMMYLVLTALLALNVSKDVLNSFRLVDDGLKKTIQGFSEKNESTYDNIELSAQENPKKAGKIFETSKEVKSKAEELITLVDGMKTDIIKEVNPEAKTLDDLEDAIDNIDVSATVMVLKKRGEELRGALNEYKDFLKSKIEKDQTALIETIDQTIETEDPKTTSKTGPQTWVTEKFQSVPMIAAITLLTKIQSDIRNIEGDMANYLYSKIDASSFKFNKLEPVVISKSNYVLTGGKYEADIFLAASDTTKAPNVYYKAGYSVRNFNSETFSSQARSFKKLEVGTNGRAKLSLSASKPGIYKWGGVVEFIPSSKVTLRFPFESSYEIAESSVTVSADKMNVFYIGVNNPISISVPGKAASDLRIKTTANVKISSIGNGKYVLRAQGGNKATITVSAKEGTGYKLIGSKPFRVKTLPDPVPTINGKKGGTITRAELMAAGGVIPLLDNFDFDVKFNIVSYEFSFVSQGDILSEKGTDARFTSKMLSFMKRLKPRQKVYFENIKARGPDKITRNIGSVSLKIK